MTKLVDLFSQGEIVRYKKGQIIITPQRSPQGVDLIEKGFVRVYSSLGGKKQSSHIIYKTGEAYPLLWALKATQKNYYYQALDDVVVRRISRKQFLSKISQQPQLALKLVSLLADRLDLYQQRVDNLIISKSAPKIVARLLFFADRFGTQKGSDILIDLPLTQEYIADSIAIARETVNRELQRLEQTGLISYQNNTITIKDKARLVQMVSKKYVKEKIKTDKGVDQKDYLQSSLLIMIAFSLCLTDIIEASKTLIQI